MPEDRKMVELVNTLVKKTNEGKIPWEATSDAREFLAAFGNYSVTLREAGAYYSVRLLNSAGEEIESLGAHPASETHRVLAGLYEQVRRRVSKVEESLDEVLKMLAER